MTTGGRLREVREYLCLSPQDVASATGVNDSELVNLEEDDREPDQLVLRRLARAYGYPPSYFSGRTDGGGTARVGIARLSGDMSSHDREELDRFTAFLRDTADC
jgi:transcriptional regulator with XRE-family HTH domain